MTQQHAHILICLIATLTVAIAAHAQVVYECDFENEAERELWHMNEGARANLCNNNWYINQPGNSTRNGNFGLFISDTGEKANYSSQYNENVVAYRTLTLPEGEYSMFFNWMGKAQASSNDGIWVCWVPEDKEIPTSRSLRSALVDDTKLDTVFNNQTVWRQSKVRISSDGKPHKLAFVWTNSTSSRTIPPSGCVDDIEIIPAQQECQQPSGFKKVIRGTTMTITWSNNGDWYDAKVYDIKKDQWQYFDRIATARLEISDLSEGAVEVFVRSHCNEGYSQYANYTAFFFLPGRCINYLAFDDPTQCKTFIGTATQPRGQQALVDSGYASSKSRHTLHYIPGETDPRTKNVLPTKPADAIASVRLGNWETGAQGECMEYTYQVPENQKAILKLRYAIVLDQPSTPHDEKDQSSFSIQIQYLENNGRRLVDLAYDCGKNSFHIGYGDPKGWHSEDNGTVMWREWDEVAISLSDYAGKTVVITLSTADCTQSGHFSYAYFTLDCESGELEGLNCGEGNPTTYITAPAGFNYAWYLPSDPDNVLSTQQSFTIAEQDTMTYYVDCISLNKQKCHYTLEACGIPRYPVAKGHYKYEIIHCQNVVTFYNDSYIYYHNKWREDAEKQHYTLDERPQEVVWDFGDGNTMESSADSIVYIFPDAEMTIEPKITASISDGRCTDSYSFEPIHLIDPGLPEKNVYLPKGAYYHGKFYFEPMSFDEYYMVDSCEELTHITIVETEFSVDTSFCEGGYYMLGNERITQSVTNKKAVLKSTLYTDPDGNAIDSIVTLNLHVEPQLKVSLDTILTHCADNLVFDIPYAVQQGKMDTIIVRFDQAAQEAGFNAEYGFAPYQPIVINVPQGVAPGRFNAVIDMATPECPVPAINVLLQNNYPADIIDEKGPFLAVFDSIYNGGYTFATYQWYRNGEVMEGENKSYIVLSETNDGGNAYSVAVTVDGETISLPTCPVIYKGMTALENNSETLISPTWVERGEPISVNTNEPFAVYDILGRKMLQSKGEMQHFQAPQQQGAYLIIFQQTFKTVRFIVR